MTRLYKLTNDQQYANEYMDVDELKGIVPIGYTDIQPPPDEEGFAHYFLGGEWRAIHLETEQVIVPSIDTNVEAKNEEAPRPRLGYTRREFLDLFSMPELINIYNTAKTNIVLEIWIAKLNATTPDADGYSVYMNDPLTQQGIEYLKSENLITSETYEMFRSIYTTVQEVQQDVHPEPQVEEPSQPVNNEGVTTEPSP